MNLTVIGCILVVSSMSVVLAFHPGPPQAGGGSGGTTINPGTAVPPMDSSTALDNAKLNNPLKKMKKKMPPRRICLMVEPTPFTHVSGMANRFKEMLKFLKKAGDDVDVLTVDSKTPAKDLPKSFLGYPIRHTLGFTFPLYNHISLTFDLPEMKGAKIIETFRPDVIHVTSPGFLLFAAIFYARTMKVPLVMSYHTHLPSYGMYAFCLRRRLDACGGCHCSSACLSIAIAELSLHGSFCCCCYNNEPALSNCHAVAVAVPSYSQI
jgi:Glycosyltransferase Family 4